MRSAPGERWFWNDPKLPALPPPGTMPGTPQATAPAPGAGAPAPIVVTPAPAPPPPAPK
jgi:hypothetical protein